ncbi:MAG: hypothetical protein HY881_11965 [Deltaproteobacteria bacterium]|nr:hypothetical protein [Deltaproteobacteria bacterium]
MKRLKGSSLAVVLSAAGLCFCLLSAFRMTDVLCITQGCSVYEDFSVFGISPYWFGAAAFLMLLCFAVAWRGRYLTMVAALFLMLDSVFLATQILFWPCMKCLIVAVLFGAVMAAAMIQEKKTWMKWVMAIWFVLFFVDMAAVAKESISPWPVYGYDAAPVHLYFSPTCPSCRGMIDALLAKTDAPTQIALYPISKNSEDTGKIMFLEKQLKNGMALKEAMALCMQVKDLNMTYNMAYWRTILNTFKNLSALSRMGVTHVPFLVAGTSFWSNAGKPVSLQDDCPVFSKNASGLCEDTKPGGLKELFKSK